ncbi:hypothetical protein [Thermogemmatispora tikiterensis]|uniref:Uncharacterized protein n=1 Tax=Thermogemmatispora tikiterensis TaxID=1825093 RepID=A0A328VH14_9CHLR|nr:hypothetical protein [Thermogemmatispora tikiterensis]RAQ96289.1 hypothetical protein A4R35_12155 [Thermogemmatispora tikiterensis]
MQEPQQKPEQAQPGQPELAGSGQTPAAGPGGQPFQPAGSAASPLGADTPRGSQEIWRTSLVMAVIFFFILVIVNACSVTPVGDAVGQGTAQMTRGLEQSPLLQGVVSSLLFSLVFSLPQDLLAACVYFGAGLFMSRRLNKMRVIMLTACLATLWFMVLDALLSFLFILIGISTHGGFTAGLEASYFLSPSFLISYFDALLLDLFLILIFGLGGCALGALAGRPSQAQPMSYPMPMPYPMPAPWPAGWPPTPAPAPGPAPYPPQGSYPLYPLQAPLPQGWPPMPASEAKPASEQASASEPESAQEPPASASPSS